MTNEQAIKHLEVIKGDCALVGDIRALDMGILALSKNKGEWIYDKGIHNWRCSKCGQTPPPTGYVGMVDFMATHFKFCNHCGADMRGEADGK